MTALEIAIGATSAITLAVYAYLIVGAILMGRTMKIEGAGFWLFFASIIGSAWFVARLWGFA